MKGLDLVVSWLRGQGNKKGEWEENSGSSLGKKDKKNKPELCALCMTSK